MFLFNKLYYIPIIATILIVAVISFSILLYLFRHSFFRKKIEDKLESFCEEQGCSYVKCYNQPYDYVLDVKTNIFYIKLLPNYNSKDLYVLNETDWRLTKINKNIEGKKLGNLESFLKMKFNKSAFKRERKLLVIYPNAKVLIKKNNDYEDEFIYKNTEVFGVYIITASELLEAKNLVL